jgi:hypothetical protein
MGARHIIKQSTAAAEKYVMRNVSGLAALLCLGMSSSIAWADEPAAADTAGWKTIPGGHGTGCATDATPYEFYVHEGDPHRLAIYFQGGGGCWNSRNCGLDGQKTFENAVDDGDRPWLNKAVAGGILDASNPANPLREFTIVFAPYCTADVHLGVRTERFETSDGKSLSIAYRGLANAQRVMDWMTHQYAEPKQVFVSGGSAGAIPSPIFASQLARHYPKAQVVQLGDGAGAYRTNRLAPQLELWGATRALKHDPLYGDLDVEDCELRGLLPARGGRAQPAAGADQQHRGSDPAVLPGAAGPRGEVAGAAAERRHSLTCASRTRKLRTYTMSGAVHTVLTRPDFYTSKGSMMWR